MAQLKITPLHIQEFIDQKLEGEVPTLGDLLVLYTKYCEENQDVHHYGVCEDLEEWLYNEFKQYLEVH